MPVLRSALGVNGRRYRNEYDSESLAHVKQSLADEQNLEGLLTVGSAPMRAFKRAILWSDR